MTTPRHKRPAREALKVAPIEPFPIFLDYYQCSTLSGYAPSYIRRLCDRGELRFVISRYFRGRRLRRVRLVPYAELASFMERRFLPPTRRHSTGPPQGATIR